ANCGKLPFDDVDLTILISNAMENAVRSALEYRGQTADEGAAIYGEQASDGDTSDSIRFTAGVIANEFAVQIENPCAFASISHRYNKTPGSFLPADAFVSTTGGGIGLRRIEDVTKTYDGGASFCFDSAKHIFITRMTLSMLENGRAR
ncbi:MAG: GHKL domain-containing protein, partial [Lachnospiraceae bacterium]|nr:GHKL domain-containing protein [Lachnospiraceae bacterium]